MLLPLPCLPPDAICLLPHFTCNRHPTLPTCHPTSPRGLPLTTQHRTTTTSHGFYWITVPACPIPRYLLPHLRSYHHTGSCRRGALAHCARMTFYTAGKDPMPCTFYTACLYCLSCLPRCCLGYLPTRLPAVGILLPATTACTHLLPACVPAAFLHFLPLPHHLPRLPSCRTTGLVVVGAIGGRTPVTFPMPRPCLLPPLQRYLPPPPLLPHCCLAFPTHHCLPLFLPYYHACLPLPHYHHTHTFASPCLCSQFPT